MRNHTQQAYRLMTTALVALLLAACSSTPTVKKSEDIKSDEKTNVVFLGHTVDVGPLRIETGTSASSNTAGFMCEDIETGKERSCFTIPIQFQRKSSNWHSRTGHFLAQGANPYRMKFGRYRLSAVTYAVVIGTEVETVCDRNSKGKLTCYDRYDDVYDYGRAPINEDIVFTVSPGEGCYLGHIQFAVQFDELLDYNQSNRREEDLDAVREGLSEAIDSHVTSSCL